MKKEKNKTYCEEKKELFRERRRKKHNNRCRRYQKEMADIAGELGNCTRCFKEKDNPKFKLCSKCRELSRIYNHKNQKRKNKMKGGKDEEKNNKSFT